MIAVMGKQQEGSLLSTAVQHGAAQPSITCYILSLHRAMMPVTCSDLSNPEIDPHHCYPFSYCLLCLFCPPTFMSSRQGCAARALLLLSLCAQLA